MKTNENIRALAAASVPALVNRFNIAEVAVSGRYVIAKGGAA